MFGALAAEPPGPAGKVLCQGSEPGCLPLNSTWSTVAVPVLAASGRGGQPEGEEGRPWGLLGRDEDSDGQGGPVWGLSLGRGPRRSKPGP